MDTKNILQNLQSRDDDQKRIIAGSVSILLVALLLFVWWFAFNTRITHVQRGARQVNTINYKTVNTAAAVQSSGDSYKKIRKDLENRFTKEIEYAR